MRGILEHDLRQLARRGGGDHLAAKAALDEQRQAPAVIEVGVREQDRAVNTPRGPVRVPTVIVAALLEGIMRPMAAGMSLASNATSTKPRAAH